MLITRSTKWLLNKRIYRYYSFFSVLYDLDYPSKQEEDVRSHWASTKVPSHACDPLRIKAPIHGQSPGAEANIVMSPSGRSWCMWIGRMPHSIVIKNNGKDGESAGLVAFQFEISQLNCLNGLVADFSAEYVIAHLKCILFRLNANKNKIEPLKGSKTLVN